MALHTASDMPAYGLYGSKEDNITMHVWACEKLKNVQMSDSEKNTGEQV